MQVTIYLENLSDMFFVLVTLIAKSIDLKVGFVPKGHSKISSFPKTVYKMSMNILA